MGRMKKERKIGNQYPPKWKKRQRPETVSGTPASRLRLQQHHHASKRSPRKASMHPHKTCYPKKNMQAGGIYHKPQKPHVSEPSPVQLASNPPVKIERERQRQRQRQRRQRYGLERYTNTIDRQQTGTETSGPLDRWNRSITVTTCTLSGSAQGRVKQPQLTYRVSYRQCNSVLRSTLIYSTAFLRHLGASRPQDQQHQLFRSLPCSFFRGSSFSTANAANW
ncbi:hypothetical protein GGI35DRAFT_387794 [Trichoderma velutinum]